MAKIPIISSFFILCLILCPTSSTHSLHHHYVKLLNVSESIRKTNKLFSNSTTQLQDQKYYESSTIINPNNSWSVTLHPYISIIKPIKYENYSTLVRSRLAYSLARMDFIHSKLNPAQSKVSQHKPHLQLAVISGISQRIPEYLARIGVGSPVKDLYVLIDTGSSLNWIQCVPCFHCNHAIFNPLKSSSFRRLSCTSPKCAAIRSHTCTSGNTCIYGMEYADESMTIGELASETLTFGCSSKVDNVAIGCGHNSSGNVEGIDGIFGFSPSILSLPSQIKATSFSYCLVDSDSTSSSTLDFNLIPPKDSIIVPMVINSNPRFNGFDSFFYVEVIGISVGRERLSIAPSVFQIDKNGNGGVIVDSGTTVTVLPPEAYRPLREVFTKHMRRSPLPGNISLFDTCYDLSLVDYAAIPTISFHFSGGKTLVLGPRNCLTAVDSKGTFCLSFLQNYLPVSFSILGNSQQQGIRISFDLTNKLIGFSPNKC